MPYGITQRYLPPGRGDIPAFTQLKLVLDYAIPDLVGLLHTEMVYRPEDGHPSKY